VYRAVCILQSLTSVTGPRDGYGGEPRCSMRIRWPHGLFRELPEQMGAPFNSCTQPGCVLVLVLVLLALLFPLIHGTLTWLRGH
jgi:hypothetical protein